MNEKNDVWHDWRVVETSNSNDNNDSEEEVKKQNTFDPAWNCF